MSTALKEPPAAVIDPDMVVTLGHVGWDGLQAVAKVVGDRSRPRILYREGSLTLVTPSQLHEYRADRLDSLIKAISAELRSPLRPTGSTLFRRQDLDHGIMADKTYYIAHEASVWGVKMDIDLNRYPPPDLAIEVVVTHPATQAVATCRALGIPEVWVYDVPKGSLTFLHLNPAGAYDLAPASRAFPFLMASEILPWVESPDDEPFYLWDSRLRTWAREVLGPRRAGGGGA